MAEDPEKIPLYRPAMPEEPGNFPFKKKKKKIDPKKCSRHDSNRKIACLTPIATPSFKHGSHLGSHLC